MSSFKKRLADERGFTLWEILIAAIVVAIIAAIAVPAYLKLSDRVEQAAAPANIRAAIPGIEAFNADNVGSATDADSNELTTGYEGMTVALLQGYDAAIKGIGIVSADTATYCVSGTSGAHTYYKTQATEISTAVCA